jgi:hypothetical protein
VGEEERDSHPSWQNKEGQHKRPKWYDNTMYDVQEDELPKGIEGQSTRLGQQIVQGSEQVYFALTSIVFQVFKLSTFEEAKGKHEWKATMKVKYDALMKNATWVLSTLPP